MAPGEPGAGRYPACDQLDDEIVRKHERPHCRHKQQAPFSICSGVTRWQDSVSLEDVASIDSLLLGDGLVLQLIRECRADIEVLAITIKAYGQLGSGEAERPCSAGSVCLCQSGRKDADGCHGY